MYVNSKYCDNKMLMKSNFMRKIWNNANPKHLKICRQAVRLNWAPVAYHVPSVSSEYGNFFQFFQAVY